MGTDFRKNPGLADMINSQRQEADTSWGGQAPEHEQPYGPGWTGGAHNPSFPKIPGTGGAAVAAGRYQGIGSNYTTGGALGQERRAPQIDYSQALQDRAFQVQSRGGQQFGGNLALMRALGYDSAAQRQAALQSNQFYAQSQSGAAGARGPAAMAMAQQNAAATNAAGQSQIAGNAAVAAAQERQANTQMYINAQAQQRAQDLQSQGLSAQQAQAQAQLEMQQNQTNDQYQLGMGGLGLGYERMGYDVNKAQLDANLALEQIRAGNWKAQSSLDEHRTDSYNPLSDVSAKQNVDYELPPAPVSLTAPQDTGTQSLPSAAAGTNQYGAQIAHKASEQGGSTASRDAMGAMQTMGSFGNRSGSSPDYIGSASKVASLALLLSDERAKTDARKEGANALVRAMQVQPAPAAHVAYYPRAGATDQQAMAQAAAMHAQQSAPPMLVESSGVTSARPMPALARAVLPAPQLPAPQQPITSDQRAKADAHIEGLAAGLRAGMQAHMGGHGYGEAGNEIKQVMDRAPPATWEYKPGMGPGGRQAGPMAQDLERAGPVGESMVYQDPKTGLKAIDAPSAVRFSLAANALNNERLNKLEGGDNALVRAMNRVV